LSSRENVIVLYIRRGVYIGMSRESTGFTLESRLVPIRAVTLLASAALLRRIPSIYIPNLLTFGFRFISQKLFKLIETPRRYPLINLLVSALVTDA
jgi:hypothetical protein